jgi:hypothetical protein
MLLFLGPLPAYAVDGVIEINQVRALAGGVVPGDGAGFPVVLLGPGSYRLTSDLVVPNENTTAILSVGAGVSVDLNGFAIRGPTVCSGFPPDLTCSPTGAGSGVVGGDIRVANGLVTGMGNWGIEFAAEVDNVVARYNGAGGIGGNLRVSNSSAEFNGGPGVISGSNVANSHARYNSNTGISANYVITASSAIGNGACGMFSDVVTASVSRGNGDCGVAGTTVTGSTTSDNIGDGIAFAGTVTGCTTTNNGGDGIGFATTVTGSMASFNGANGINAAMATGSTAVGNVGTGIVATTAIGNTVLQNTALNLQCSGGFQSNVIFGGGGTVSPGCVNMGQNVCNGSSSCP